MKLLAALWALAPAVAAAQDFHLDQVVGPDTFLVARLPKPGALAKGVENSKLYKLYTNEALRKFLLSIKTPDAEFEQGLRTFLDWPKESEKELGKPWLEAFAGLGEIAIAIPAIPMEAAVPDVYVTLDLKGDAQVEAFILKMIVKANGERAEKSQVEGTELSRYGKVWVGKFRTVLFLSPTVDGARAFLQAAAKPPAKSLATSDAYRHALRAVGATDGSLMYYVNTSVILQQIQKQMGDPAAKALLDAFGLSRVTYGAFACEFDPSGQVIMRGHLNADLSMAVEPLDASIFDKRPSQIEGKIVSLGYANTGAALRKLFHMLTPILEMGAQQSGAQLNLEAFPLETVAELAGTARDAFIGTDAGLSFYSRSDLGFSPTMFGGSSMMTTPMLAAIMMPALLHSTEEAKKTQCTSNLKQMGTLLELYRKNFGGPNYELPNATGKEFWKEVQQKMGDESKDVFTCPCSGKPKGTITYRGPARNINVQKNYRGRDVIACDDPDNHPDGINVLTKSYQVIWIPKGTPEYEQALKSTKE
jgi:hypothetical protein